MVKQLDGKMGNEAKAIWNTLLWFDDASYMLPYANIRQLQEMG